jgi:hypothetical protein
MTELRQRQLPPLRARGSGWFCLSTARASVGTQARSPANGLSTPPRVRVDSLAQTLYSSTIHYWISAKTGPAVIGTPIPQDAVMSRKTLHHQRRAALLMPLLLSLLAAGCGNRLPQEEIVAAAGGQAAAGEDGVTEAAAESGGETEVAGPAAGTPVPEGGSAGGASGGGATAGANDATGESGAGDLVAAQGGGRASGPSSEGADGDTGAASTILLGNVGTYSGPIGTALSPARTAVKVWEAATNARGGIGGHPVKVLSADDQGDPAKTRAIVQDMVENKKVVAFVGIQPGANAEAIRPYLEEKRVPAVGGDLGTAHWHQSPMFFGQGSTIDTAVLAIARTAAQLNKKKIAALYCASLRSAQISTTRCKRAQRRKARRLRTLRAYHWRSQISRPSASALEMQVPMQ